MNRIFFLLLLAAITLGFASDQRLIKLVSSQWDTRHVQTLLLILHTAEQDGLNEQCLENKVREGIAKNKSAESIIIAVEKRETALRAIVKNEKNASLAAQSKLLFETEKASSHFQPVPDRHDIIISTSNRKTPVQLKEAENHQEVPQAGRMRNQADNTSSLRRTLPDEINAINEDKLDKRLEKQELKLEKLEQKQERNSARLNGKK
jgi:hypothetical protein